MVAKNTEAKIAARLGNVEDWQVFGVYEYALRCRTCVCGHSIARTFVLIRKGDHGPAFNEMAEIGSECIKYVKALSPDLYTWLMTAKKEQDALVRRLRAERVQALASDPEFRAIRKQLATFVEVAKFVTRHAHASSFVTTSRMQQFSQEAGIVIDYNAPCFYRAGALARAISTYDYEFMEEAANHLTRANELLGEIREKVAPVKEYVIAKFAGKSDYIPGTTEVRAIYTHVTE